MKKLLSFFLIGLMLCFAFTGCSDKPKPVSYTDLDVYKRQAVGMLAAAGCRDRTGFQYTVANGAFLMLCTVSGSRCCGVGDPVAGGMSCFLSLISAGAFMPVLISIGLPVAAITVGMLAAAGCRDRTGFHYITALGAFLMLCTVSGSRCFGVDDPAAGGMSRLAAFDRCV